MYASANLGDNQDSDGLSHIVKTFTINLKITFQNCFRSILLTVKSLFTMRIKTMSSNLAMQLRFQL